MKYLADSWALPFTICTELVKEISDADKTTVAFVTWTDKRKVVYSCVTGLNCSKMTLHDMEDKIPMETEWYVAFLCSVSLKLRCF